MKIPKYIHEHIERNNRLLEQALKHQIVVEEWYDKQLHILDYDRIEKDISDDDMCDIKGNPYDVRMIFEEHILHNIQLLEKLKQSIEEEDKETFDFKDQKI